MGEYWKSLPKKYCDVCKCWFTDNKASTEFHERGGRHQANVRKKLNDLIKKGSKDAKEHQDYNNEIMKIEAAAMGAFAKDVAADPTKAKEYSTTRSMIEKLNLPEKKTALSTLGRFGETSNEDDRYRELGREKALETIASKMEKKSQWLESKTAEGTSFYWNRKTFETVWEPPKQGYLTVEEQGNMNIGTTTSPPIPRPPSDYKYNPLGSWQTVEQTPSIDSSMPDLQLPPSANKLSSSELKVLEIGSKKEEVFEFKEKTLETPLKPSKKREPGSGFMIKKRKITESHPKSSRQRSTTNDR